jgi:hypothetical protein
MWLETVEILQAVADLPRLELTVIFTRYLYRPGDKNPDWAKFMKMTQDMEAGMLEAYKQIFEPLKRLHALKALFIHVAFPWRVGMEHVMKANEQMLERSVMGEAYDSDKRGKAASNFYLTPR